MANYYDELLKVCGFEDEEINRERPRLEKAFQRLELGPADMKTAETWVKENHEVELLGVRKILGLWLRELVDLVLTKDEGKKLVYYGFPTISGPAMAIAAASEQIYCTCPDIVLCYSMGQIFNKLTPIIDVGHQHGLPDGHALCTLQVIRVGGMAKGIIPVPDVVLTSSYFCDMGSKTDELLHHRYGHPAVYVDGSRDSAWGEYPHYQPETPGFLASEINRAFDKVGEILGVEITDAAKREGATRGREIFAALRELGELMKIADPQPISTVTVEMARRFTNGSASMRIITEGAKAIGVLNQEVRERMDKGIGVVEKGAPRVMITVAHFADPRVMHMIENSGLSIPVNVYVVLASKTFQNTPIISGEIMAEEEMARGSFHSTYGLIKRAAEAAQEFNADGFIWNYMYNCRPVASTSHLLKQFVEKETGIPVLSLEFDGYDSRNYSAESMRTKVEHLPRC